LIKRLPDNGLVLFCGYSAEDAKKKLVVIEPLRPLHLSMNRCDDKFHTEMLREQITADETKIGFVVIDGHSASFYLLYGTTRETLWKHDVNLPKKHGRGGQSQKRFERIRDEKRGWFVSKVAENFLLQFTSNGLLSVSNLVFAGCAELKYELAKKLDQKIQNKILAFVDVQYGGEAGFHQAVDLSSEVLRNSRFVREKVILNKYFGSIAIDNNLFCYYPQDSIEALESGAVETLLVWEGLQDIRCVIEKAGETRKVVFKKPEEVEQLRKNLGSSSELVLCEPLLDWVLENFKNFGSEIEIISTSNTIGEQFVQGFGGIGALLRYPIEKAHELDCLAKCGDGQEGGEIVDEDEDDDDDYDYIY